MILFQIHEGIQLFLTIIRYLILIYWVLSLFRPNFKAYFMLESFLAPLLRPFRVLSLKLMAKMRGGMMIDFSIWFALIALGIVSRLVGFVFFNFLIY